MLPRCLSPSFPSIPLTLLEQITNEDLQDGRKRCCSKIFKMADNFRNSKSVCRSDASHQVLAKSDLWFGRNCRLQNSRWWLSWISKRNDFSDSESLCYCDASHQVLAQSNSRFGRRCLLKNFKMAAILDIGTELL